MLMKALVRTELGVRCLDVSVPTIRSTHDVLIRVSCAAICRTDVFAALGAIAVQPGRILGHEFTGIVEAVGAEVVCCKPADRVVVNPLLSCGTCPDCEKNQKHECSHTGLLGIQADGAFAQWIVVHEVQVFKLSESICDAVGAYAEPLAATMAILDAGLSKDRTIAVTGVGRIADLTKFILQIHGYDVTAPDSDSSYEVVVETDLCNANVESTLRLVRPGGLLILKSRMPEKLELPPVLCIIRRIRLQAVYYARFDQALELLDRYAHRLTDFVGGDWPLEEYDAAFTAACADGARKIYFKPNG